MKKTLFTVICVILLLFCFITCDGIGITGGIHDPVEDILIRRHSISAGDPFANQYSVLETTFNNPYVMTGTGESRVTVRIDILPETAPFGFTVTSSHPTQVWFDMPKFRIVANGPADLVVLTFTSTGKMANGLPRQRHVFIRSTVVDTR